MTLLLDFLTALKLRPLPISSIIVMRLPLHRACIPLPLLRLLSDNLIALLPLLLPSGFIIVMLSIVPLPLLITQLA